MMRINLLQLSTIHSHLDEMDKKLNNLEEEVHESMTASQVRIEN